MSRTLRETADDACKAGDLELLERLAASRGPEALRLDDDLEELTGLHYAAASGCLDLVRFFLSPAIGSDPTAARGNNFTPLHGAAMFGHTAVCEALLEAGADVNTQTKPQGYAPLHSAAFGGHVETIRLLLLHGADRGLLNYRDERPADTANRTGQLEATHLLDSEDPKA
ncbi:ankyrin repeat domain-containing protein [bacterium]|nr:ankyrin repeat domain-containing protein [bacterium]